MRYVSRIMKDSKEVKSLYAFEDGGHIAIRDTDGGEEQIFAIRSLWGQEIFGLSMYMTPYGQSVVAVCHTMKTAKLHEYIEFSGVHKINSEYSVSSCEDLCVIGDTAAKLHIRGRDNVELVIDSGNESFAMCGPLGSVVVRTVIAPRVYTLFDTLSYYCNSVKSNLMRYQWIHVCSGVHHTVADIKLKQTPEALRFFTKMYFEICKG